MLFNSFEFAVFFTILFLFYWFVVEKKLQLQNLFLLIASYFFYGWWDWRFLLLLIFVSCSNYFLGILIERNDLFIKRRYYLAIGLIINLGILVVFKYYNFFIDSFIDLLSIIGYNLSRSTTKIILPLGISFYVFLSLSYLIDIYKKTLKANKNIIDVLLSLGFFPIIFAGPIQRPSNLLQQIVSRREFNYDQATDGLRQILWGLFVKVVIADNLAFYSDDIFLKFPEYSGSTLLIGVFFYSIQIYADFSGYSNMAIGVAKLLGFNLMQNFAYPYFSRDITEFWKRWHISLTTWFRDYIFLPVSFAISWRIKKERVLYIRTDMFIYIAASIITWFLTGLWHGANYTYIIWGMINGFFLIIYRMQVKSRKRLLKKFGMNNNNLFIVIIESFITLALVMIAWVFFRSQTISQALEFISIMFSQTLFTMPDVLPMKLFLLIFLFIMTEWFQKEKQHALQINNKNIPRTLRWAIYYGIILAIVVLGGTQQEFIYFQF